MKGALYSRTGLGSLDPAVDRMSLCEDEVHVVCASLDRPSVDVARLYRLLAADERDRAARFRFERDRSRYVVGRGLLRLLLARYVEGPPEAISFAYGRFQKPRLRHEGPAFNLSHSGPLALYAFTREEEVGVDIELDDADFARERIAELFFSPTEVAALRSLPEALQPRAFLTCWTRKEAFIKARGDGLQLALDSFDVSLVPTAPPELLSTQWSRDEPKRWSLRDLSDPEMGYIAALALRGRGWRLVSQRLADNLDDTTEPQQEDI